MKTIFGNYDHLLKFNTTYNLIYIGDITFTDGSSYTSTKNDTLARFQTVDINNRTIKNKGTFSFQDVPNLGFSKQYLTDPFGTRYGRAILGKQLVHNYAPVLADSIMGDNINVAIVDLQIFKNSEAYKAVVYNSTPIGDEYFISKNKITPLAINKNTVLPLYNHGTQMARYMLNYAPKISIYGINKLALINQLEVDKKAIITQNSVQIVNFSGSSDIVEDLGDNIHDGLIVCRSLGNDGSRTSKFNDYEHKDRLLPYYSDALTGENKKSIKGAFVTLQGVYYNQCGTQLLCPGTEHSLRSKAGDAKYYTLSIVENGSGATSEATATFSGMVALMLEANEKYNAGYTPRQIVEILFQTAKDIGDPGLDEVFGWGTPDLEAAFNVIKTKGPVTFKLYEFGISIDNVQYHTSGNGDEWIKLYNSDNAAVDISGWTLNYNGNTFTFPSNAQISAMSYLTIAVSSNGDGVFNNGNPFTPDYNSLGVSNSAVKNTNNKNNLGNENDIANIIKLSSGEFLIDTYTSPLNIALNKPATQSSAPYGSLGRATTVVDGNVSGVWSHQSVSHTYNESNPWWRVDLESIYEINKIEVFNRTDCCNNRLNGAKVYVGRIPSNNPNDYTEIGTLTGSKTIQSFDITGIQGQYIMVRIPGSSKILSLAEVRAYGTEVNNGTNIALNKPATQSSAPYGSLGRATTVVDGNVSGVWSHQSVSHTYNESNPWWRVDLESTYEINKIEVFNRTDCCNNRLNGAKVYVGSIPSNNPNDYTEIGTLTGSKTIQSFDITGIQGQYIMVRIPGSSKILSLAEVRAYGTEVNNGTNIALNKPATQSSAPYGSLGRATTVVDGNVSGVWSQQSVSHTYNESNPWWRVDLESTYEINKIEVFNRTDCCNNRLNGAKVYVGSIPSNNPNDYTEIGTLTGSKTIQSFDITGIQGQYIMVRIPGSSKILSLAEVRAYGTEVAVENSFNINMPETEMLEDEISLGDNGYIEAQITVSPNPSSGIFNINYIAKCKGDARWILLNGTTGRIEQQNNYFSNERGDVVNGRIEIPQFDSRGLYILNIFFDNGEQYSIKLIKK